MGFCSLEYLYYYGIVKKQNFEPGVQTTKSPFKQKFVSLSEIPRVKQLLPKKLKSIYQRKTTGLSEAIFDESNILEVIDTLNNANYSFSFILPTAPKGQLFNLIIGKNKYGEIKMPFVLKYTCNEAYVDEFIASNNNLAHFKGTISVHKYTDYFEKDFFSKTTNHDCTEFDQFGDPIPCEVQTFDGTSTGGKTVSVGTPSNGTGFLAGGCTLEGPYVMGCGASSSNSWHLESTCGGNKSIALYSYVWDCDAVNLSKSATDCPPCTTSNDGVIGINTISILTMRATLKKVLNLRGTELAWVAHDDNITEVGSIYAFLERNEVDGVYFPEAVSFADLAMEAWMENKNTLVDFEDKIILDETFLNNPRLKCVYDKFKAGTNTISNYLENFLGERPVAHLEFEADDNFVANYPDHASASAITSEPVNFLINITFNTDNSNSEASESHMPTIILALEFIHEMVHAEMFRKLLSYAQEPNIPWTTFFIKSIKNDFGGLSDYYTRYWLNLPPNQAPNQMQHQAMAEHYRSMIVDALKDFDNNQHTNEFYKALAWAGLKGTGATNPTTGLPLNATEAWKNLTPTQRADINSIISNTIQNETHDCN